MHTSARILNIMKTRTISLASRSTPASRKSSNPLRALLGARGSGTATAVCVVVFLLFLVVVGFVLVAGGMARSFVVALLLLVAVKTSGVAAAAAFVARVVRQLMM